MNPVRGCGGRTLPRAGPFLEEKSILSVTQRAKILRESLENQKVRVLKFRFLLGKSRYYLILAFEMLKKQYMF